METVRFAVIGGSGLYTMPELTNVTEIDLDTPFGKPSDTIKVGTLHGERVAFLPRHGRGHVLTPSEVPYRANIYALKLLGVTHAIAVSACGSLREDYAPGHIVIPDQLLDYTKDDRGRSFFGDGIVVHIGVADPFCPALSKIVADATRVANATVHEGGTYVTVEGPRFSTRAESEMFRKLGCSIIGMTTSPEAYLAREAEIAYAVMAHVTDYDVWHTTEADVTVEMVFRQFMANLEVAQRAVMNTIARLKDNPPKSIAHHALANAFATNREKITPQIVERLAPIIGKYFKAEHA